MNPGGMSDKKIGGVDYIFSKMPASKALRVHVVLMRAIAELMKGGGSPAAFMAALQKKEGEELTTAESAAQMNALVAVIMSLSADDWVAPDGRKMMGLDSFARLMLETVKVKAPSGPMEIDLDAQFSGREGDLYKVVAEAMKHSFSGFLGASLSALPHGGAATA